MFALIEKQLYSYEKSTTMTNTHIRYSDEELAQFKKIIDSRLAKTRMQLESIEGQLKEITENTEDEGVDWMDDSSTTSGVEMLNTMATRQRRYLKELENALVRIRNKSYGICVVTGELIDKRRLMAVPTTTKSLIAKQPQSQTVIRKRPTPPPPLKKKKKKKEAAKAAAPKVISKVIKRVRPGEENGPKQLTRDFLDDDDDMDILNGLDEDLVPSNEYEGLEEEYGDETPKRIVNLDDDDDSGDDSYDF